MILDCRRDTMGLRNHICIGSKLQHNDNDNGDDDTMTNFIIVIVNIIVVIYFHPCHH
jgi:hypothetical protein